MPGSKSRRSSCGASTPSKSDSEGVDSPTTGHTPRKDGKGSQDLQAVNCTVVGVEDRENSSVAAIWMSEEAMVASSVATGYVVTVSVRGSDASSHPALLATLCSRHYHVTAPSVVGNAPGSFFAVATAWPSRKLARYGVWLSKHLAITLGCPSVGTTIMMNPLHISGTTSGLYGPTSNMSTLSSEVEILECTQLILRWCTPSESKDVTGVCPSSPEISTPSTKKTARVGMSPSLKDHAGIKVHSINSLAASPSDSPASRGGVTPSVAAEHVRGEASSFAHLSAAWSIFEKGMDKGRALMQIFAVRWLGGRLLLPGNLVGLPICGCDCLFEVFQAHSASPGPHQGSDSAESTTVGGIQERDATGEEDLMGILPPALAVYRVGHKTVVAFLAPSETSKEQLDTHVESQVVDTSEITAVNISSDVEEIQFSALGGLSEQIDTIKQLVDLSLLHPHLFTRYGLQAPRGILLYGPPGTGKSTLARAAAFEAGVPLFAINGPDVVSQFYGESEEALRAVFATAEQAAPSVVVIDEVDAIAPERKEGSEELAQRMVGALLKLMDEGGQQRVLVIAATNRPDAMDPALRRPGRFDRELEIGVPTPKGRLEILEALLQDLKHTLHASEVLELAAGTHGFVGADLAALCNEAALSALRRSIGPLSVSLRPQLSLDASCKCREMAAEQSSPSASHKCASLGKEISGDPLMASTLRHSMLEIKLEDFKVAKTRVRPSAMREVMLEVPKVQWRDIGGQEEVKQRLQEAVEWPQKHGAAFTRIGVEPPGGVLLYGPPGCSKTMLARAVASEAGLNFIAIKGPELFSKWVGESEKAVQALFARARAASPSIVFFDEIDGLAVARDSGQGDGLSVGDRVLSQLLAEMDGLKPSIGVVVIAATNRPDIIDPALLRPGRFDRLLYVGPPNEAARQQIFQIQLRNTPCSSVVDCSLLAARTPSYTGADIAAVIREAALAALEEDVDAQQVDLCHFEIALARVGPSDPGPMPDFFTKYQRG